MSASVYTPASALLSWAWSLNYVLSSGNQLASSASEVGVMCIKKFRVRTICGTNLGAHTALWISIAYLKVSLILLACTVYTVGRTPPKYAANSNYIIQFLPRHFPHVPASPILLLCHTPANPVLEHHLISAQALGDVPPPASPAGCLQLPSPAWREAAQPCFVQDTAVISTLLPLMYAFSCSNRK